MQKKIIALAIAGLVSGGVYAQTNVTVYGRIDQSYVYSKSDYKKFSGIESGNAIGGGASRLGFQGTESLGNGLKAIFKFEWAVAADVGGGPTGARYTWVGLQGNFGTVRAGRVETPRDIYFGGVSAQGINGYEVSNIFIGQSYSMELTSESRWDNAVSYTSPNLNGFEGYFVYSSGEKVSGDKNEDAAGNTIGYGSSNRKAADIGDAAKYGIGLKYANGPLYLSALYIARADDDSVQPYGATNSNAGYGAKAWALGGAYDFKVVKLYANYWREKANDDGRSFGAASGTDKQTAWTVSAGIPVSSAGTVSLEYGQFKDYRDFGPDTGNKTKGWNVGYRHNLSKRTWLWGNYAHFDNDKGIASGWSKTRLAGEDQNIFGVGIVHLF
jgi:predicted porin